MRSGNGADWRSDFVIPDDIKSLAYKAIEHRIRVKSEAEMDNITPRIVIERTLDKITGAKNEFMSIFT